MRSFVIVIRSAYFGAQKRRKYAKKNVGVNLIFHLNAVIHNVYIHVCCFVIEAHKIE